MMAFVSSYPHRADLAWYAQHFLWWQCIRFLQDEVEHVVVFLIKIIESAYSFIAYVIEKLTSGNGSAVTWSISSFITSMPLGVLQAVMIRPRFSSGRFGCIMIGREGRIL